MKPYNLTIHNLTFNIELTSEESRFDLQTLTIYLNKDLPIQNKRYNLTQGVTRAYLLATGHDFQDTFTLDQLCAIMASLSEDIINDVDNIIMYFEQ